MQFYNYKITTIQYCNIYILYFSCLVGKFLNIFGKNSDEHYSKILLVFKRKGKITSAVWKNAAKYPRSIYSPGFFGAKCNGRILVGHECGLYEYKTSCNEWVNVPLSKSVSFGGLWKIKRYHELYGINENLWILLGCGNKGGSHVGCLQYFADAVNKPSLASMLVTATAKLKQIHGREPGTLCTTVFPLKSSLRRFKVTNIGKNKIMMFDRDKIDLKDKVFQVTITENTGEIIWKQISPTNKIRNCSILFKMKGSVYAIGEMSCEQYNLHEEIWVDCHHDLPNGFSFRSSFVAVSKDESFALITRVIKDGDSSGPIYIFIFTEYCGFQIFDNDHRDRIKLSLTIE